MKHLFWLAWLFQVSLMPLFFSSCSPIRSSPHEQKHQVEMTIHEMQTDLDDLRHDVHCFQTEFEIIDGKIKHFEDVLGEVRQKYLAKMEESLQSLRKKIEQMEATTKVLEETAEKREHSIKNLSRHAEETTFAFSQYKKKMEEIEFSFLQQEEKLKEMASLKTTLEEIAQALKLKKESIYQVQSGDSLEKIAKHFGVSVEELKKHNHLKKDLIVKGQKLKIPSSV